MNHGGIEILIQMLRKGHFLKEGFWMLSHILNKPTKYKDRMIELGCLKERHLDVISRRHSLMANNSLIFLTEWCQMVGRKRSYVLYTSNTS